jgi:hypothetical protein
MAVLKAKYKNIPQVARYIRIMLENNISPRDIDLALDVIQYEQDAMFLEAKLGEALATKILDLQASITATDPAGMLTRAREIYQEFKENGEIQFDMEIITTEEALKEKLSAYLSDEEIAGIMKGDE